MALKKTQRVQVVRMDNRLDLRVNWYQPSTRSNNLHGTVKSKNTVLSSRLTTNNGFKM